MTIPRRTEDFDRPEITRYYDDFNKTASSYRLEPTSWEVRYAEMAGEGPEDALQGPGGGAPGGIPGEAGTGGGGSGEPDIKLGPPKINITNKDLGTKINITNKDLGAGTGGFGGMRDIPSATSNPGAFEMPDMSKLPKAPAEGDYGRTTKGPSLYNSVSQGVQNVSQSAGSVIKNVGQQASDVASTAKGPAKNILKGLIKNPVTKGVGFGAGMAGGTYLWNKFNSGK